MERIKLVIDDFCNECGDFEADVNKFPSGQFTLSFIECKYRSKCLAAYNAGYANGIKSVTKEE